MKVRVYKIEGKHKDRLVAQGTLIAMNKHEPLQVWGDPSLGEEGITTTNVNKLYCPDHSGLNIVAYTENSTYRVCFEEVEYGSKEEQ